MGRLPPLSKRSPILTTATGTSSYDQFRGTAGGGWEAGWVDGKGAVDAGASGVVSNTNPVNGGGNYLTISDTDGIANNNFSGYQRELSLTSPGVDLYTTSTLSLDIRMESAVNDGTQVVFWNSGDGAGLGGPNGFETRAFNSNGAVQWTFRDGAARVDSGVNLIQGHTYSFDLTLYATPANTNTTYDITVTDLDNSATATSTGLTYRNAGSVYDGDPMIFFGLACRTPRALHGLLLGG